MKIELEMICCICGCPYSRLSRTSMDACGAMVEDFEKRDRRIPWILCTGVVMKKKDLTEMIASDKKYNTYHPAGNKLKRWFPKHCYLNDYIWSHDFTRRVYVEKIVKLLSRRLKWQRGA